jgi:hypothetical protein
MPKAPRKRRTREHVIADLSVNFVERQVLLCGYTVERVWHDYGYDLFLFTYNARGEAAFPGRWGFPVEVFLAAAARKHGTEVPVPENSREREKPEEKGPAARKPGPRGRPHP